MTGDLWPHQEEALAALRHALGRGKRRPMLQAPTGSGKTRIAAEIVNGALRKGKRVVFTVPLIELVEQTVQAFWNQGIRDVGVIQGDHPDQDWSRPVQVASVQTLMRRLAPPPRRRGADRRSASLVRLLRDVDGQAGLAGGAVHRPFGDALDPRARQAF